jgi:hypothetical protein
MFTQSSDFISYRIDDTHERSLFDTSLNIFKLLYVSVYFFLCLTYEMVKAVPSDSLIFLK